MASALIRPRWQRGAQARQRASYGPGGRPYKAGLLARLRQLLAAHRWLRLGAQAAVLPLAAGAFWALVQATAFAGGEFGYFELGPWHIVVIVLLANIAALALLGLIFEALDWLGPAAARRLRRYGRWLRRRLGRGARPG